MPYITRVGKGERGYGCREYDRNFDKAWCHKRETWHFVPYRANSGSKGKRDSNSMWAPDNLSRTQCACVLRLVNRFIQM